MPIRTRSPATARRNRPPSSRRSELLDVAADLFAARGFTAVTMDDIGAAAGISGPALYHHFVSKEALLGEMLVTISGELLAAGEEIVGTIPRNERLDTLVTMHAEFAVDRRALIAVQFRDLVNASEADRRTVRDRQRAYVDLWATTLVRSRPSTSPAVARSAVHAVFGLINSTPFSGRLRRNAMVALLERMAHGALAAAVGPTGR